MFWECNASVIPFLLGWLVSKLTCVEEHVILA